MPIDVKDGEFNKKIDKVTKLPYSEDIWVWAPTGVIKIHYPELWGVFYHEGIEVEALLIYAIPEDEKIKWLRYIRPGNYV